MILTWASREVFSMKIPLHELLARQEFLLKDLLLDVFVVLVL